MGESFEWTIDTVRPLDTVMKIPTYTQTAGLERFPQHKRFGVYRATHKRLLNEDFTYQRRWQRYIAAVVC
jgi:hypothetical protein